MHWLEQAACGKDLCGTAHTCRDTGHDSEAWFPHMPMGGQGVTQEIRDLQRVCVTCPVTAECLDFALRHGLDDGIWAGTTPAQRRRLRRVRRIELDKLESWLPPQKDRRAS